jgi:hypothetical protein
MRGSQWNGARVVWLKKHWNDGLCAHEISKKLGGVTRNKVVSKLHSLGLFSQGRIEKMRLLKS